MNLETQQEDLFRMKHTEEKAGVEHLQVWHNATGLAWKDGERAKGEKTFLKKKGLKIS